MRYRISSRNSAFVLATACLAALCFAQSTARERAAPLPADGGRDPLGVLVLDGSGVHDVGELLLHTGNWGIFGSYPSSTMPISQYPSAEWPAGSGIEHLYIAGLWVGALKGCSPGDQTLGVSTAAFETEFRPTADPIDRIYETYEGAPGGNRVPSPYADDDGDGTIDEDFLDGRDNDDDGLVDEDFAAISQQMFSSWYTDDQPEAIALYPEHTPLNVTVRQESYQWTDPRFDDFVGVSFFISNTGGDCLDRMYVGMLLDFDVGSRDEPDYWADDHIGYWEGIRCTELGPASLHVAYVYDTVDGLPRSYCGAMLLGHTVYAGGNGVREVGVSSLRIFSGDQPYENGGDPTNDFQRYELMSSSIIDRVPAAPRDYRILMSSGLFGMVPGESLEYHVGFVCGATLEEMLDNAAMCQKLFDGLRLNLDGNPLTGIDRRETPVEGPAAGVVIDSCRAELSEPISLARGERVWINADCSREAFLKEACGYGEADSLLFRTGVGGREGHVRWLVEEATEIRADLDIRPHICPNPFGMWIFDLLERRCCPALGMLPAAILGSDRLDVREIDISTVRLEGVPPLPLLRWRRDVSSFAAGGDPCECGPSGPDGHDDLVLRFSAKRIAEAILEAGPPQAGEQRLLTLRGELKDGTPFEASDCVLLAGPPPLADAGERSMLAAPQTRLLDASPNPFNPATTIRYELASPGRVTLAVYDVAGRLVRRLADGRMEAGPHEAVWDGLDDRGRAVSSGIYFYRLAAPGFVETRKMVLLR